MGQKIGNLSKWNVLAEGEVREFPGDARVVVIEVNAPEATQMWVTHGAETPHIEKRVGMSASEPDDYHKECFLCLVEGRDTIEFAVEGPFSLSCEGGDLWYYTADQRSGAGLLNREVGEVIFTKIANRKSRNSNLEMMQFRMQQNAARRERQLLAEVERRMSDLEARYAARPVRPFVDPAGEPPVAGGAAGAGGQPPKAPTGKAPPLPPKGGTGGTAAKAGGTAAAPKDDSAED